jgi:hypothetical protein
MNALAAPDRERLMKLCGLFASSFAGERDAAVLAAMRFLRERNLTWHDVIAPENLPSASSEPSWRENVAQCIRAFDTLTEWEKNFIVSLRSFRRLSAKQIGVLRDIASKARARAAA